MSLRFYLGGEDITDKVDVASVTDPGEPAHLLTEEELRSGLGWSPCAINGCQRTDAARVKWPDEWTFVYLCHDHLQALGVEIGSRDA